jgi:hypothetical protein
MNLLRKNVIPSGAFAALLLLTALANSTPARAFGASLSGTVHPIGLPVITTTIPPLVPSSKMVTLATGVEPGAGLFPLHRVTPEGEAVAGYVVPAGQDHVITSVEITPFQNGSAYAPAMVYLEQTQYVGYKYWLVSNLVSTSFEYPTGFVIKSGSAPLVLGELGCIITIHGYLTPA